MALRHHPVSGAGQGRRLLLGGSATTQPLWLSRQAARYYDSDDDSGIGHSHGGQGERVGSTSSAETEVPHDFSGSGAQLSPGNLQKWWGPGPGPRPDIRRQISPGPPVDPWLPLQRVPPALGPGFCPPAVSTPEGSECADEVFHPYKATLVRLPTGPNPDRTRASKASLQKCKSFSHNSGPSQGKRNLVEARRVWSYCGDGNYYPNVYENLPKMPPGALPNRTRTSTFGYLNREALANHYDVPVSRHRDGGRMQGAKSASLSSLITEVDLVRVHAFPASVIPASEMGDAVSDSVYGQPGNAELSTQLARQPQPPMGLLRPPLRLPRTHPPSIPNSARNTQFCPGPPLGLRAHQAGREGGFKDCAGKDIPTPLSMAGEVAYATVVKPRHKMNTGQKAATPCTPAAAFADEIEPPLPPRNYRRDLTSSKHLATSKSSLTDKMQGFSRTAKQALRQAFSMEGLNCASDSAHNDSDEWDNESDWGRVINPKPRTPAAVKARDANRQKLKRSNSAKHPTTMATLC